MEFFLRLFASSFSKWLLSFIFFIAHSKVRHFRSLKLGRFVISLKEPMQFIRIHKFVPTAAVY